MNNEAEPLLSVTDLEVEFPTDEGRVTAVRGVSFSLAAQETLAIVGESGSGKSVTAMAIMRLLAPPGRIIGGSINFDGQKLAALSPLEMRKLRGRRISMIFQEPMTSLNPVLTIGTQIGEVLELHRDLTGSAAEDEAIRLLCMVGISSAEERLRQYAHELSGGMKQRVMIAMALACEPALLIADEPTTALDVTIQAQILDELKALQKKLKMAVLLITHDLGIVAHFADRVAVMYAGKIVEEGPVRSIFHSPKHPYTISLLAALPGKAGMAKHAPLAAIAGQVPSPLNLPSGCAFSNRCPDAIDSCLETEPVLHSISNAQNVACNLVAANTATSDKELRK